MARIRFTAFALAVSLSAVGLIAMPALAGNFEPEARRSSTNSWRPLKELQPRAIRGGSAGRNGTNPSSITAKNSPLAAKRASIFSSTRRSPAGMKLSEIWGRKNSGGAKERFAGAPYRHSAPTTLAARTSLAKSFGRNVSAMIASAKKKGGALSLRVKHAILAPIKLRALGQVVSSPSNPRATVAARPASASSRRLLNSAMPLSLDYALATR